VDRFVRSELEDKFDAFTVALTLSALLEDDEVMQRVNGRYDETLPQILRFGSEGHDS